MLRRQNADTAHCWGFAEDLPTLAQLQQQAWRRAEAQAATATIQPHQQQQHQDDEHGDAGSFLPQLESSHAFTSNACVAAMAAALGLDHLTDSLAGTTIRLAAHSTTTTTGAAQKPAAEAQHETVAAPGAAVQQTPAAGLTPAQARQAVWQQVDNAWSDEAVRRGVSYAKAGGREGRVGEQRDVSCNSCCPKVLMLQQLQQDYGRITARMYW